MTPRVYKNQINVAERDDVCYSIIRNTWSITDPNRYGRFEASVHWMPQNRRWHTDELNANGYATERSAMAAIRRNAKKHGWDIVEA